MPSAFNSLDRFRADLLFNTVLLLVILSSIIEDEVGAAGLTADEDAFAFLEASNLVAGNVLDLILLEWPVTTPWLLAIALELGEDDWSSLRGVWSLIHGACLATEGVDMFCDIDSY